MLNSVRSLELVTLVYLRKVFEANEADVFNRFTLFIKKDYDVFQSEVSVHRSEFVDGVEEGTYLGN